MRVLDRSSDLRKVRHSLRLRGDPLIPNFLQMLSQPIEKRFALPVAELETPYWARSQLEASQAGIWTVAALYGGPYLVVNAWLVMYVLIISLIMQYLYCLLKR